MDKLSLENQNVSKKFKEKLFPSVKEKVYKKFSEFSLEELFYFLQNKEIIIPYCLGLISGKIEE